MNTRDHLLDSLKGSRDAWVSGRVLSEGLAVTRTAIWKQIRSLKDEGYEIEASTRKGYRLCGIPDRLLMQEIRDGLTTRLFGRTQVRYFRQTDSTNRRAGELAAQGAPEGTLVVAEQQTQGRGRRGRGWYSPPQQGIYASLILRPAIAPMEAPRMTLLAAVAVTETLLALTPLKATIKWPNDILVRGRKIAGILTEISTGMDVIDHVVIGLGLNVNVPADEFPAEIRGQATSIKAETGDTFSRARLLQGYLERLEHYYDLSCTRGFDQVLRRWRGLCDMLGRRVRIDMIGTRCTGEVLDFDREGFLILRDNAGRSVRIFSGDVTFLKGQNRSHD